MDLGKFSVSLAVNNIGASRAFYEKLGFEAVDGDLDVNESTPTGERKWLMMKQGDTRIGLFQAMFGLNVLTFHPSDLRAIQQALKERGIDLELNEEGQRSATGPAHGMLVDPDGNPILLDQF